MILVTGGNGFLGSYLLRYLLERDLPVRALKRRHSNMDLLKDPRFRKVEWVEGDILDVSLLDEAMQGVDQVYHCAAMVSFNPRMKEQLFKVNVEGTANVVNAALDNGIQKLLHVSSISALGRKSNNEKISELTPWKDSKFNSQYAQSKFRSEQEIWRGIAEGLDAVIINPAVILGAGDWSKGTPHLLQMVWNGLSFYASGINGFVDVRDVASIMIQLMESPIKNERFILSGDNLSYREMLNAIADHLKRKRPSKEATGLIKAIAWRLEKVRSWLKGSEPIITRETSLFTAKKFFYDNKKIKNALDVEFIPIQQTLMETCQIFLEHQPRAAMLP